MARLLRAADAKKLMAFTCLQLLVENNIASVARFKGFALALS